MKINQIVAFLILIVAGGCVTPSITDDVRIVPVSTENPISTTAPRQTITDALTPTVDLLDPSSTPIETTNSSTNPTATPSPSITKGGVPVCSGRGNILQPSEGFGISGTIVYQQNGSDGLYTIGGTPLRSSRMPVDQSEKYLTFGFSPSGKWFAYRQIPVEALEPGYVLEEIEVTLLSAEKEEISRVFSLDSFISELPQTAHFEGILSGRWINEDYIFTELGVRSSEFLEYYGTLFSVPKVFAPQSGSWVTEFQDELPESGIWKMALSSDMRQSIYFLPPDKYYLWDQESEEVIWEGQIETPSVTSLMMNWAPDNNTALIANRNFNNPSVFKIVLISKSGELYRVIASTNYPEKNFFPFGIIWSPDSKFIAMADILNGKAEILIYDVDQDEYLFRCPIPNGLYFQWSPDSRFLAVGGERSEMHILDIEQETVTEIVPLGIPVGWSETFPVEWP